MTRCFLLSPQPPRGFLTCSQGSIPIPIFEGPLHPPGTQKGTQTGTRTSQALPHTSTPRERAAGEGGAAASGRGGCLSRTPLIAIPPGRLAGNAAAAATGPAAPPPGPRPAGAPCGPSRRLRPPLRPRGSGPPAAAPFPRGKAARGGGWGRRWVSPWARSGAGPFTWRRWTRGLSRLRQQVAGRRRRAGSSARRSGLWRAGSPPSALSRPTGLATAGPTQPFPLRIPRLTPGRAVSQGRAWGKQLFWPVLAALATPWLLSNFGEREGGGVGRRGGSAWLQFRKCSGGGECRQAAPSPRRCAGRPGTRPRSPAAAAPGPPGRAGLGGSPPGLAGRVG